VAKLIGGSVPPLAPINPNQPPGPGGADPNEDDTMMVRRDNVSKIDYAYDSRNFILIKDPTHYNLLKGAGFITVNHGEAPEINTWDIEWIRGQVIAWGGTADEYVKPGK
jgi:hypothetical protein